MKTINIFKSDFVNQVTKLNEERKILFIKCNSVDKNYELISEKTKANKILSKDACPYCNHLNLLVFNDFRYCFFCKNYFDLVRKKIEPTPQQTEMLNMRLLEIEQIQSEIKKFKNKNTHIIDNNINGLIFK